MRGEASSEQEQDDSDVDGVEVDPTGRYVRYKEVLGKGAFKKVYRAFDELEGLEVAWNQVKVSELLRNAEDLERLYSEVHLLKTLKHKNIIKFYNSWVDTKNEHINFITEIFTSGTLRQYRKKHKRVDLRALKKWSKQILEGLQYLHSHDPPIIHRDLKCDNIFVNGNHGELKIGDLGLAAILHHANAAHSVIGTPEFMAPELYEEEYNELVDIYAFGMCLLELVTFEYPYVECSNAAQIYKKVTLGIKPASLTKVTDPDVKAFIEKCIADVAERLSAKDLLSDPFLSDVSPETTRQSSHVNIQHSDSGSRSRSASGPISSDVGGSSSLDKSNPAPSRDLSVHGERKDVNTIFIKLRIADSTDKCRNIHFPFDIEADTSIAVASEMVNELDLTDQDIPTIADMIDSEIRALIPDWSPVDSLGADSPFDSPISDSKEETSPHQILENKDDTSPMATVTPSFFPDQLPSGRKFWSDAPRTGNFHTTNSSEITEEFVLQNGSAPQDLGSSDQHEPTTGKGAHDVHGGAIADYSTEDIDKTYSRSVSDKNIKDIHDHGGLPPLNSSIFHVGSDDNCMSRENRLRVNPGNINIKAAHEPATTENKDMTHDGVVSDERPEDQTRFQEEISCSGKGDAVLLSVHSEGDNTESDLRIIADELDQLLAEHQKQLDELKCKHRLAISQVLKDLPPHMYVKVLNMCSRKIPEDELPGKTISNVPNTPGKSGAGSCSSKRIYTRSLSTVDLSSPKLNKQESITEMGIAVILKSDLDES